jgi:transposase InsO family protein
VDQRHTTSDRRMDCTQITEAFPWAEAPRYLIRDRDRAYGAAVTRRLRAMGILDKPIAAGSPWQNGFAERLIGSIRRECVDHVIVLGEALTPDPDGVCCLLQRVEDSSISWQRRSNPSCYPAPRSHRIGAGRGWPPPALLSNLVFGTDNGLKAITSTVAPQAGTARHRNSSRLPKASAKSFTHVFS